MTFSLVARCEKSGMFGLVISSSSPAVAARCSFARAGVGAVSSQNVTDPALGPAVLDLMEKGRNATKSVSAVMEQTPHREYRQVLAVDANGDSAVFSGGNVLGIWSDAKAKNAASAGNLLANTGVPDAMIEAFDNSHGHLGDRLLAALKSGLAAGGEAGPVHSAGLKIVDKASWPIADLRCDWSDASPIEELSNLWKLYQPQMDDYLQRALDPSAAPSYGVPGDDTL